MVLGRAELAIKRPFGQSSQNALKKYSFGRAVYLDDFVTDNKSYPNWTRPDHSLFELIFGNRVPH